LDSFLNDNMSRVESDHRALITASLLHYTYFCRQYDKWVNVDKSKP